MLLIFFIVVLYLNAFAQDGLIKSYYSNGNIKSEINFVDSVRDGEAKFYSENGILREERVYLNGRVEGLVKNYSETGLLKEIFIIENGKREGPTSVYDENGNFLSDVYFEAGKLVIPEIAEDQYASVNDNSEEESVKTNSNNNESKPKVVKSKKDPNEYLLPPEIEEEKLEDDPAFFSTIEVMPEPVGGMEAVYKKLIYPSEARKNEVVGTVKIQAFVDEYGEVMEAEIIEGIGSGCDDVARNAIYFAKFKPGLQKGKPIRTIAIISIKFNPEMNQN
jgi:TonB family protein